MKFILSLVVIILLTACQHNPISTAVPQHLLQDDLFQPVETAIETPEQIFALPEQNKTDMQNLVRPVSSVQRKTDLLLTYLFSKKGNALLYQNDATLTASQTLAEKQANCLSLTILAYSLAQEAELYVEFRDIKIPEYWTQNNGHSMLNGHVNLKVAGGKNSGMDGKLTYEVFSYVIDFDIETNKSHFPSRSLTKKQVIAMFYNNKAAEAMVFGQYDRAYAYLKAAMSFDPGSTEAWNNLAVLYRQKQQYQLAEQAYLWADQLSPDQLNAKANLALLYELTGQLERAQQLSQYVAEKRSENPYYHIMLGHEALLLNNAAQALVHYKKGLSLDRRSSEAMLGLAKAHLRLGQREQAEQYLLLAEKYAPNSQERERYQSKLKLLTTAAVQH
jgi:tetratricopeptide (TPR) repeat protein